MASPSASFSERTELRSRHCIFPVEPSETTRARLPDVCTSPGIESDMRCTPSGHPATARITFTATSLGSIPAGLAHFPTVTEMFSSIPSNSSRTVFSYAATAPAKAS